MTTAPASGSRRWRGATSTPRPRAARPRRSHGSGSAEPQQQPTRPRRLMAGRDAPARRGHPPPARYHPRLSRRGAVAGRRFLPRLQPADRREEPRRRAHPARDRHRLDGGIGPAGRGPDAGPGARDDRARGRPRGPDRRGRRDAAAADRARRRAMSPAAARVPAHADPHAPHAGRRSQKTSPRPRGRGAARRRGR
jgi:hypothetical protein